MNELTDIGLIFLVVGAVFYFFYVVLDFKMYKPKYKKGDCLVIRSMRDDMRVFEIMDVVDEREYDPEVFEYRVETAGDFSANLDIKIVDKNRRIVKMPEQEAKIWKVQRALTTGK